MDVFNRSRALKFPAIFFLALFLMIVLFPGAAAATAAPAPPAGEDDSCSAGSMSGSCSMACCEITCRSACLTSAEPAPDIRAEDRGALPCHGQTRPPTPAGATGLLAGDGRSTGLDIPSLLLRPPQPYDVLTL